MYCNSRSVELGGIAAWTAGFTRAGHDCAQQSLRKVEAAPHASRLTRCSGTVFFVRAGNLLGVSVCGSARVSPRRGILAFFFVAPCGCRPYMGIVSNKRQPRSLVLARADAEDYDHDTTATVGQPVPLRAGPAAHDA